MNMCVNQCSLSLFYRGERWKRRYERGGREGREGDGKRDGERELQQNKMDSCFQMASTDKRFLTGSTHLPTTHPPVHPPAPPTCPTHSPRGWPPSWQPSSRPGSHAPCPQLSLCSHSTSPSLWSPLATHPECAERGRCQEGGIYKAYIDPVAVVTCV